MSALRSLRSLRPARAPAVRHSLPVPVPPVPAGLESGGGVRLVAGLTWEIASGPEAPVLRADAPPVLRLPDRRARLAGTASGAAARAAPPGGSLLLALAAGLSRAVPDAAGPWAFIAELPRPDGEPGPPRIWTAVADITASGGDGGEGRGAGRAGAVSPRPGREGTADTPPEALDTLRRHLDITDIAGLAVRWLPVRDAASPAGTHRGAMIRGIAALAPDVPLHDVEPDTAGMPTFVPPRRVPVRPLAGTAAAGVAALVAAVAVVPAVRPLLETPPPPPPETVGVHVAPGAFAEACAAALDAWWPRVTGWRARGGGCAVSGYLPEDPVLPEPGAADPAGTAEPPRLSRPMVAWRVLVPVSGRNAVLARAAADRTVAAWPHGARTAADTLTLWRAGALPLVPADGRAAGAPALHPDPEAVRDRLAARWADTPDAVTRGDGDGSGSGLFEVRVPRGASAAAVLSRSGGVPGIAPVRLELSVGGAGALVLAPVTVRQAPAALVRAAPGDTLPDALPAAGGTETMETEGDRG